MSTPRPLDSLVIDVLLDNLTDSYSTKPANVSPEFTNVLDSGVTELSGKTLCCAQLGLSVMLTAHAGGVRHKLLFDAGPEGEIFVRNCKNLGVALDDVEEVAISHGHWDHMGALLAALNEITQSGRKKVKVHVNSGMFFERGALLADGRVAHFENVPDPDTLSKNGAIVVNDDNERLLLDDFFYLSGDIPRVTAFEKGRMDHVCRETPEQEWHPDPLLVDERYLACNVKDKGLIVFSSCSHAGIVNVLYALRDRFPSITIYGVFGGLHLVGTLEKIIPDTINGIKQFAPKTIMPAHCTGFRAHYALLEAFGESIVVPSAVGSRYHF